MIVKDFHSKAIISDKAIIGSDVRIGAFSIIEDDVIIGNNVEIDSSVYIANGARIGNDCKIYKGVVIATEPQDLKFGNEYTNVFIGDRTILREYVTVNRGTKATGKTIIGSDCFIMAYCHVAHDCHLGNNIIIANGTQMAGHVEIEDYANIGGVVKIHQFSKIGMHSMIGADTRIIKDVPPFTLIGNEPARVEGINKIGLKRRGFSQDKIKEIDEFYKVVLYSGLNNTDGIARYKNQNSLSPEIEHCIEFIEKSKRGIIR